jgi:hypothetical protein
MNHVIRFILGLGAFVFMAGIVPAQFDSGSTGADGSLNIPADTSYVFDMSTKPDGVWNFTDIVISQNATVTFQKNASNTPVIWLASGDVTIAGTLDLRGADASTNNTPGTESPGGPGGFAGGLGGRNESASGSFAGMAGQGPGGGKTGTTSGQRGGNAGHATAGPFNGGTAGGAAYGNRFLRPLIGGAGGGGQASTSFNDGVSGSGGGGGIRIASSGDIQLTGSILASGGIVLWQSEGGNGSGGAIHLIANRIQGTGTANASGGTGQGYPNTSASSGYIRFEGFYVTKTINVLGSYSFGPPSSIDLTNQGIIVIETVAGENVASPPGGLLVSPDVVFSDDGEIVVGLQTTNIPAGTTITVQVSTAGDQILATSTPVDGAGAATATMTVPAGVGVIQAWATY